MISKSRRYFAEDFASVDAIDEYLASLADPDFWFVSNNVVAAWGSAPMT
jgi:hypothetical protein